MRMHVTAIEFAESITKLKSFLYHVAQKVQAPKYCRHGEDFGTDGINSCAPDCDTFQHLDCGCQVEKLIAVICDKNSWGVSVEISQPTKQT